MPPKRTWFLRKNDGAQYGPVSLADLMLWSAQCRVIAGNAVSFDRETWFPVENIPELEMNWVAHRSDGKEYGPFSLQAANELFKHHVLPADAILLNRVTGEQRSLQDVLGLDANPHAGHAPSVADHPTLDTETPAATAETPPREPEAVAPTGENPPREPEAVAPAVKGAPVDALEACRRKLHLANEKWRQDTGALQKELQTLQGQIEIQHRQHTAASDTAAKKIAEAGVQIETLRAAMHGANVARTDAERKMAHMAESLSSTEQAAQVSTADLRKQVAFMKKNIAAMHAELESWKRLCVLRGKILVFLGVALSIAAMLIISRNTPSCRATQTLPTPAAFPVETAPTTLRAASHPARPWPTPDIKGVITSTSANQLMIRFDEGIFSHLTTLSESARNQLEQLAVQLRPSMTHLKLVVEGHTDDIPMRSTEMFSDNTALAKARAKTIREFLTEPGRLPPDAVTEAQPGATAPYPNDSEENRRRNRTVVLTLTPR